MSYDLLFTNPVPADADVAFSQHFGARRDYDLQGTTAWYANPDTGVYFGFELANPEGDMELEEDEPRSWASFNMNFARPHFFAEEAAIEILAFLDRFKCGVFDPQLGGVSEGDFTVDGFRTGWSQGNAFARRAIGMAGAAGQAMVTPGDGLLRPKEELACIWRWNFARRDIQNRLGEGVFVPCIGFYRVAGELRSATVWTDGIPTVLPKTDVVIVYRDQLAPRRWFRRKAGTAVVSWDAASEHVDSSSQDADPLPHLRPGYTVTPQELVSWISSLPEERRLQAISIDQILDAGEEAA